MASDNHVSDRNTKENEKIDCEELRIAVLCVQVYDCDLMPPQRLVLGKNQLCISIYIFMPKMRKLLSQRHKRF